MSTWAIIGAVILVACAAMAIIETTLWWCHRADPPPIPGCLGSAPGAQQRAENDCWTCAHQELCDTRSRYTLQQRARDAERQSPTDPFVPVSLGRD